MSTINPDLPAYVVRYEGSIEEMRGTTYFAQADARAEGRLHLICACGEPEECRRNLRNVRPASVVWLNGLTPILG
jgi:hypothetical protein